MNPLNDEKIFPINPPPGRGVGTGEGAGSGVGSGSVGSEVGVGTGSDTGTTVGSGVWRHCRRLTVPDHIRLFDLALAGNQ